MRVTAVILASSIFWSVNIFAQQVQQSNDVNTSKVPVSSKKKNNYDFYQKGDLIWKKRVWRVIDLNDRPNFPLDSLCLNNSCNIDFTKILVDAITEDRLRGYSHGNASVLPKNEMLRKFNVKKGTENFTKVHKYLVMEDLSFFHSCPDVYTKIISLGPLPADKSTDTLLQKRKRDKVVDYKENGNDFGMDDSMHNLQPIFWVNYKELQPLMEKYLLRAPITSDNSLNCLDFFENRHFFSQVIRIKNY